MTRTFSRKILGGAAAAVGVASFLTVAPTVHAAPACTDWVFPGAVKFAQWPYIFNATGKFVPSTITYVNPTNGANGQPATEPRPTSGGIDGSNIHISIAGTNYNGTIDQNGNASGTIDINNAFWSLAGPLKCNTPPPPAAVAPVDVVRMDINKELLTATINVNNTGAIAGKCNYDAKGTSGPFAPPLHRDFNIGPKQATSFEVPAPPLGSSYHVVLSCKGDFEGKQVEFGHVEQDVSSF